MNRAPLVDPAFSAWRRRYRRLLAGFVATAMAAPAIVWATIRYEAWEWEAFSDRSGRLLFLFYATTVGLPVFLGFTVFGPMPRFKRAVASPPRIVEAHVFVEERQESTGGLLFWRVHTVKRWWMGLYDHQGDKYLLLKAVDVEEEFARRWESGQNLRAYGLDVAGARVVLAFDDEIVWSRDQRTTLPDDVYRLV